MRSGVVCWHRERRICGIGAPDDNSVKQVGERARRSEVGEVREAPLIVQVGEEDCESRAKGENEVENEDEDKDVGWMALLVVTAWPYLVLVALFRDRQNCRCRSERGCLGHGHADSGCAERKLCVRSSGQQTHHVHAAVEHDVLAANRD